MKEKLKEIKERLNEDKLFFDKYNELHDLREHWVSSASLLEQKVEGELKKAQEESSEILILSPMA